MAANGRRRPHAPPRTARPGQNARSPPRVELARNAPPARALAPPRLPAASDPHHPHRGVCRPPLATRSGSPPMRTAHVRPNYLHATSPPHLPSNCAGPRSFARVRRQPGTRPTTPGPLSSALSSDDVRCLRYVRAHAHQPPLPQVQGDDGCQPRARRRRAR
jgi:hypothetical protein